MKAFIEDKAHLNKDGSLVWSSDQMTNNKQTQVTIDNLIARATTIWTVDQSNIFFCALSKIDQADAMGRVTVSKKELKKRLKMEKRNSEFINNCKALMQTSFVEFNPVMDSNGKNRASVWEAGYIIYHVKIERYNVIFSFNTYMMPLLKDLKSYFTKIDLDGLLSLKRMGSQKLYLYLSSWFNPTYPEQTRAIYRDDIPTVFGLTKGQYIRNKGTENERFDWYSFEKKFLDPVCTEIANACSAGLCDLNLFDEEPLIDKDGIPVFEENTSKQVKYYEKITDDPFVIGYRFHYRFLDKDGNHAWIDKKRKG